MRVHTVTWPAARHQDRLDDADVVVYASSLLASKVDASTLQQLSADERRRLAGYANPIVARRFAIGRCTLREILGVVLRLPARAVPLREGMHGKPCLVEGTSAPLSFSVSHADDLFVLALSRNANVGIDVERLRAIRQWRQLADRVFDVRERRQLDRAVAEEVEPGDAFLSRWCRVEAELKAIGCGFLGLKGHRAGLRPLGLCVADLPSLPLPADLVAKPVRYVAAVAVCSRESAHPEAAERARHSASAAARPSR